LALRGRTVWSLGQDHGEPPPEQGVAGRLRGKLNGQRNEPGGLAGSGAGAGHGRVLLEQGEQERTFGGEMTVDGPFGKSSGEGHFVERRQLEAALGEELESSGHQQGSRFRLAPLMNDSHGYLRYSRGPVAQGAPIPTLCDVPDSLQFDRAEPSAGCSACGSQLTDTYFVANGRIVCDRCRRAVEAEWNRGGAAGRFMTALGLGILATIACSILWYVVLKVTGYQLGIIAVAVGFIVGSAVRKGSNGRGGWRYQTLAIFLTYTAIVTSYVPFIIEGFREHRAAQVTTTATAPDNTKPVKDSTAVVAKAESIGPLGFAIGVVVLLGVLYAAPFLAGLENVIGILIIGFALYEAWKLNRRTELRVSGPHRVSPTGAPA